MLLFVLPPADGNAFHGFSDPSSSVYIERVAKQSHASMFLFLELLGLSSP